MQVLLAIVRADEFDSMGELETHLLTTLAKWGLQASKICGVVCDLNQANLLQASAQVFPNAGITSCMFYACNRLYDLFQEDFSEIALIKSKVIGALNTVKYKFLLIFFWFI